MIEGLFETHVFVEDLERSVDFYKNILGLELCNTNDDRRVVFFWIGKPQQQMLGVWEKPKAELAIRHFAFSCSVDTVLNKAVQWLKSKNIQPYNFINSGEEPMVFAWMPAIAIYFNDPDGNVLEFIAMLDGKPQPHLGVIPYNEWLQHKS